MVEMEDMKMNATVETPASAPEQTPVPVPVPAAEASNDNGDEVIVHKKRRVERREKLRKTAICKHFDKPGGCPFPDCKFAHGR